MVRNIKVIFIEVVLAVFPISNSADQGSGQVYHAQDDDDRFLDLSAVIKPRELIEKPRYYQAGGNVAHAFGFPDFDDLIVTAIGNRQAGDERKSAAYCEMIHVDVPNAPLATFLVATFLVVPPRNTIISTPRRKSPLQKTTL